MQLTGGVMGLLDFNENIGSGRAMGLSIKYE
jgi:hypothetical protein